MNRVYFIIIVIFCGVFLSLKAQELRMPDSLSSKLTGLNADERFDYFIKRSKIWNKLEGKKALFYSQLAYQEASGQSNEKRQTQALLLICRSYNILANYDTAQQIANKIIRNGASSLDADIMEAKLLLARSLFKKGKYEDSRDIAQYVLEYYFNENDSVGVYKGANQLASAYQALGDYPSAIENNQRALRIAESISDTSKIIMQYAKIGRIYHDMGNYSAARSSYFKGINLSNNYKKSASFNTLIMSLSSYYTRMHIYDSAEMYLQKSISITKSLGKRDDIAGEYLNMGNLLCRQMKFDIGKPNFDTALTIFKELELDAYIAKVYDSYAVMYNELEVYDSSLYYAKKALAISRKTKNSFNIRSSLYRIAAVYDKMEDYKNSLKYAKKFIFYNDSVVSHENREIVAELETKYETAKKERDIIQLKAEQKAQEDKELIMWISLAATLVIFGLIVRGGRQKRKKDKTIHENEKALAAANLEKSRLKEEELEKEIQYKSKQLTTHALSMMQKNTFLKELQTDLSGLSKCASSVNEDSFTRLNMLIKKNLQSEKDWDLFKLYFEDVNRQFYKKLEEVNPDLTSYDLKLCALLKLNMNIKESATVMNIEPDSVKKARYKLRKKLSLRPEDDLAEFIMKIG